jgi:20S proteasome alpha/beta subunit
MQEYFPIPTDTQREIDSMTFQVGLVAANGIVIASDKRATIFQPNIQMAGSEYSNTTTKIYTSFDNTVTCAFAGDETGPIVAGAIIGLNIREDMSLEQTSALLKNTADAARQAHIQGLTEQQKGLLRDASLLVALPNLKRWPLWKVIVRQSSLCSSGNRFFSGGIGSSAIYISEFGHRPSISVDEAVFLASHTVLEAGRMNPAGIDGLDVFVHSDNRIGLLLEDDIDQLKLWSASVLEQTRLAMRGKSPSN